MNMYEYGFISGFIIGVFSYHVLLNKIMNHPKMKKLMVSIKKSGGKGDDKKRWRDF